MEEKYKIIKFIDGEIELDVRFSIDENTVWLSQKEMALLFEMSTDNISLHIKNILKTMDNYNSVVEESSVTASDGKTYKTKLYNLEIILAVGYRTKSNRINKFNNWVKEKLKELNNELIIQNPFNYANNYEIVKFESGNISLDINVSPSEDTVWLTQNDMANLFDKSISTINEHINNILVDELNEQEVCKFGKTEFAIKPVKYYNLDMVLSVGYRANSKSGIEFRRNEYCRLS